MKHPISITAIASISPLGHSLDTVWKNYKTSHHFITQNNEALISELSIESKNEIEKIRASNNKYKALDDTVLFAIYCSRAAIKQAKWEALDNFGINIGSSRGATHLFENYHKDFLESHATKPLASPTTTLGNIASWVAQDLKSKGPEISHSITCSTALHAMINGIAWIQAGLCNKFLVGGSEAPLTPFTIAQMKALKIYCRPERKEEHFPCQALNLEKTQNTMILGEGAASICLESDKKDNALAWIKGFGYATESLEHGASLSANATCFQHSMKMALSDTSPKDVDVIVTHTPGTVKGDQAEYNAIKEVFCNKIPFLTTNKWKIGHTLGASGMFSIEMAILMLLNQHYISTPFLKQETPKQLKTILVNAVGFGGNAVSILLSK